MNDQTHTPASLADEPRLQAPDLDAMIAWEQGELTAEETTALFQSLVNSGLAWKLQGMYGRQAAALIDAGVVFDPRAPI